MQHRIDALRQRLREANYDAWVSLSAPANEYLTGFRGSASAVIVSHDACCFICDFRYTEQARAVVAVAAIEECNTGLEKRAGERLAELGLARVAFDGSMVTVEQRSTVAAGCEGVDLISDPRLMASLRQVKDAGEIDRIRAANNLAEGVLADLLPQLVPGVREREFAALLEYEFKRRGASGSSFPPIVLFGARSSLPHGVPGDKPLEHGDIVLLDFGCVLDSYCSDLTRTFVSGSIPAAWFEGIYAVTLEAQLAALDALRPGVRGCEVDRVARDIIDAAGYGDYFGHGLGHGVGLEIHEAPRLNRLSETILEPGMIVTVEPGIYLPGQGGVRIEDIVAVTDTGCEVLSKTPKELKVINA